MTSITSKGINIVNVVATSTPDVCVDDQPLRWPLLLVQCRQQVSMFLLLVLVVLVLVLEFGLVPVLVLVLAQGLVVVQVPVPVLVLVLVLVLFWFSFSITPCLASFPLFKEAYLAGLGLTQARANPQRSQR